MALDSSYFNTKYSKYSKNYLYTEELKSNTVKAVCTEAT